MELFKRKKKPMELPPALMNTEDPVNYNTVLDYLVGLSDKEYRQMTQSAEVYRKANKEVAKIVGVKDEPTTTIVASKPSEEEVDEALTDALEMKYEAPNEPEQPKPTKKQSTSKKIEIDG